MDALLTINTSNDSLNLTDLRILDDDKHLVSFSPNRAQQHYLAHRTSRNLIVKSRQLGFSTLIQGELFCAAVNETCATLTLTHLDKTTQALRRMADRFYNTLSLDKHKPKRKYANATVSTYVDTDSEAIIATAGSVDTSRGLTITKAHFSEVAFWKDAESVMTSALQAIPMSGSIDVESTANGAQGWFYEQCIAALRGDSDWTLHFYEWWWADKYRLPLAANEQLEYTADERRLIDAHGLDAEQIKWRRFKIRQIGERGFLQEFPEDIATCFLSSGAQVFGDFKVYTPEPDAKPIAGHECVAGLDTGQDNDYSALSIINPETNKEVFIGHWRHMPWHEIRTNVLDACAYWNVGHLYVERNAASATIEALDADAYARKLPITISGITTTLKRKGEMVIHLRTAIQEDGLELLDEAWASAEMRAVQTKQTEQGVWTYTSPRDDNGHGDGVIARMLAVRASLNRIGEYK